MGGLEKLMQFFRKFLLGMHYIVLISALLGCGEIELREFFPRRRVIYCWSLRGNQFFQQIKMSGICDICIVAPRPTPVAKLTFCHKMRCREDVNLSPALRFPTRKTTPAHTSHQYLSPLTAHLSFESQHTLLTTARAAFSKQSRLP